MRRGVFILPAILNDVDAETTMAIHGMLTRIHRVELIDFGRRLRYEAESPLFDDLPDHLVQTPTYSFSVKANIVRAFRIDDHPMRGRSANN